MTLSNGRDAFAKNSLILLVGGELKTYTFPEPVLGIRLRNASEAVAVAVAVVVAVAVAVVVVVIGIGDGSVVGL